MTVAQIIVIATHPQPSPQTLMNTDSLHSENVINQMIALRHQLAQLQQQIDALKPAFFDACAAQAITQLRHPHATISRKLTPGKWDYPSHILDHEQHLKQLKQQFQQTHEPSAGREIIWTIRLHPQL